MTGRSVLLLGVLVLHIACVPTSRWGMGRGVPSHYAQSMNSAVDGCMRSPAWVVIAPGEEALVPGVSRVVETAQAMETLQQWLTDAQVRRIEQILVQCAKNAEAEINEQEYGPGRFPDDAECNRLVRDNEGKEMSRAAELGKLKHAAAFACVRRQLEEFSDTLSLEPRYGKDPSTGKYVLTQGGLGSISPDVVLHAAGDANQAQCVYDFKFPCVASSKSDPLGRFARGQLEKYDRLQLHCPPAIVTPQLGISHE
jgi:hypothetical protein